MLTKEEKIQLKELALEMAPKERPYISPNTGFLGNMAIEAETVVKNAEIIYKWLTKEDDL